MLVPIPINHSFVLLVKISLNSSFGLHKEVLCSTQFQTDGFVVLENFATEEEIAAMKAECFDLVEKMNPSEHHTIFSTTKQVSALVHWCHVLLLNPHLLM